MYSLNQLEIFSNEGMQRGKIFKDASLDSKLEVYPCIYAESSNKSCQIKIASYASLRLDDTEGWKKETPCGQT